MENGRNRQKRDTKGKMERNTTYFGARSRKGGVGFGRGRGEQCVPVVRRTHLLSLPGWSDGMKRESRNREKKVNEVCSSRDDMTEGAEEWRRRWWRYLER